MKNEDKKTNKVIGLAYEPGKGLPKIVVKGHGKIADEILKKRPLGSKVDVIKNSQLVDKLYRLPVDAEISQETFQLVATVLSHVFAVEEKLKNSYE